MKEQVLKVRMLGAFTMEYKDQPVSFERNTLTKTNQLLQLLFHAGEAGITREQLLMRLFGRDEVTNPSNSLRATVFRLRKLLIAAGFPENVRGETLSIEEFARLANEIVRRRQGD